MQDALSDALLQTDPHKLKTELPRLIPKDVQQILAAAVIRDEQVFPAPSILRTAPTLVGYSRLLLGVPQKSFYVGGTGMGQYRSMESKGIITEKQSHGLDDFCEAMAEALGDLVRQISPRVTPRDVHELPILTLGSQFQGGNINAIGKQATVDVFLAVAEVVGQHIAKRDAKRIIVRNGAGRLVEIILAGDPDIRIEEQIGTSIRKIAAIEIKGGTDRSNAHNRAGEAEKSHQKAKISGFPVFWTIIAKRGLDVGALRNESPTTNSWFDVAHILARDGEDWAAFVNELSGLIGIPFIPVRK